MKTGLLIHDVEQAEAVIASGMAASARLLSTHASADVHLRLSHDVDCQCVSAYASTDEIFAVKARATELMDTALANLDRNVSAAINEHLGLDLAWFDLLYAYYGKYLLHALMGLGTCLTRAGQQEGLARIAVLDTSLDGLVPGPMRLHNMLPGLEACSGQPLAPAQIGRPVQAEAALPGKALGELCRLILGLLREHQAEIIDPLLAGRDKAAGMVALAEPLYDLGFFKDALGDELNALILNHDSSGPFPAFPLAGKVEADLTSALPKDLAPGASDAERALVTLVVEHILGDFGRHFGTWAFQLMLIQALHRASPIRLGVWGNPPIVGHKALFFGLLRRLGVPVAGCQHGCLYGEIDEPWQMDADFRRCDHYFSYGFEAKDVVQAMTTAPVSSGDLPQIIPVGMRKAGPKPMTPRRVVDVLYPISNAMSVLDGGLNRTPPHELAALQKRLLRFLDSREDIAVMVKPFPHATDRTDAMLPLYANLKRASVIRNTPLGDVLNHFHPRAVVVEYRSQPLFDVLDLDTEIFLFTGDTYVSPPEVMEQLGQRVHLCATPDELIAALEQFLAGQLPAKRDMTFVQRFARRKDTAGRMLTTLNAILANEETP
jgi:hypothetical protein